MTPRASDHRNGADLPEQTLPDALRVACEWLPVGILIAGSNSAIVLANRAVEHISGYRASELLGQPVEVLVPDAQRTMHSSWRDGFLRQPRPRAMAGDREVFARRKDGSEVAVQVFLTPLAIDGRNLVLVSLTDVSERRRTEARLRGAIHERVEFETLVGELGVQFVNLPPHEVDGAIDEALGRIVRTLNLDRSALFQVDEENGDFVHTHQWTRPGWATPPPRVSARERFPWHLARIREGELVSFASAEEVPDAVDREGLRQLGTQSGVTIPLTVDGATWGAVTFATVREPRAWSPEIVSRLRVVTLIFTNVLARKQADERLRRAFEQNAKLRQRLRDENAYLRQELSTFVEAPAIVGNSTGIRRALAGVRRAAASSAPVLLVGETGTGKSLCAHRIHALSDRRERTLVRVNCASLSAAALGEDLLEAITRTGPSVQPRQVGLALASGSTLLLHEVADLTPDAQAGLVRLLQQEERRQDGDATRRRTTFRVIATTRHDLTSAIEKGTFRDELYYLLNVLQIDLPPLRDRPEDIPPLVWRFVDEFSLAYGVAVDTIDHESMSLLQQHSWPGNARELRNVVERAMIVADGRRLSFSLSPPTAPAGGASLAAVERAHITAVLRACDGKIRGKGGAAARLGIPPQALEAKLTKLRIRRLR